MLVNMESKTKRILVLVAAIGAMTSVVGLMGLQSIQADDEDDAKVDIIVEDTELRVIRIRVAPGVFEEIVLVKMDAVIIYEGPSGDEVWQISVDGTLDVDDLKKGNKKLLSKLIDKMILDSAEEYLDDIDYKKGYITIIKPDLQVTGHKYKG